jgi:hypothetical protein
MINRHFQTRRFIDANVGRRSIEAFLLDPELIGTYKIELRPTGSIGFAL